MQLIHREATDSTPFVHMDPEKGLIELSGRSIPEDASAFYFPLIDWLKEYCAHPKDSTKIIIYLEYVNSISQKLLFDLFIKVADIQRLGKNLDFVWYYDEEDEEMYDEGVVFRNKLQLPIEVKVKD